METTNLNEQYLVIYGVFILMMIVMVLVARYLKKANPLKIEKNGQNIIEWFFKYFEDITGSVLGDKYIHEFTPLVITIFVSILLTNIVGCIGLSEGAKFNPFYTFTWSISLFFFWNIYGIYKIGVKGFFHEFVANSVVLMPIEIIGFFVKPLSMGLRLFGNITAGAILIGIVWSVPEVLAQISEVAGIASLPIVVGLGVVLTGFFGLFGPFIQATVFTYLTLVNISTFTQEHE